MYSEFGAKSSLAVAPFGHTTQGLSFVVGQQKGSVGVNEAWLNVHNSDPASYIAAEVN